MQIFNVTSCFSACFVSVKSVFFWQVFDFQLFQRIFFNSAASLLVSSEPEGAWPQSGHAAWLVDAPRGREWGSTNEEEPARQRSDIGAGGEEHLYYRSHLRATRRRETRRSPGVTSPPLILLFFLLNLAAPATPWSWATCHSSRLRLAGFPPRGDSFFREPKRSRTRTTYSDPLSLLQSWCRWTASSLSVCTPSCTSPNTLLCTPARRPSAGPACPHRRWVQSLPATRPPNPPASRIYWELGDYLHLIFLSGQSDI